VVANSFVVEHSSVAAAEAIGELAWGGIQAAEDCFAVDRSSVVDTLALWEELDSLDLDRPRVLEGPVRMAAEAVETAVVETVGFHMALEAELGHGSRAVGDTA
jgi:hypothetical protein